MRGIRKVVFALFGLSRQRSHFFLRTSCTIQIVMKFVILVSLVAYTAIGDMGSMGRSGQILNATMIDPMVSCRLTDDFRPIPCSGPLGYLCDKMSIEIYQLPGLLTCSPTGFGCCLKGDLSLLTANTTTR